MVAAAKNHAPHAAVNGHLSLMISHTAISGHMGGVVLGHITATLQPRHKCAVYFYPNTVILLFGEHGFTEEKSLE